MTYIDQDGIHHVQQQSKTFNWADWDAKKKGGGTEDGKSASIGTIHHVPAGTQASGTNSKPSKQDTWVGHHTESGYLTQPFTSPRHAAMELKTKHDDIEKGKDTSTSYRSRTAIRPDRAAELGGKPKPGGEVGHVSADGSYTDHATGETEPGLKWSKSKKVYV